MQTLLQSLQDHDRGQLSIIAELWGIELRKGPISQTAAALATEMLSGEAAHEMGEALSPSARQALEIIQGHGGRLPMAEAVRRFGPLREMGPGRRDREKPWRDPISALESLWYRGLIARAFADTPKGPLELAFIPTDLFKKLPASQTFESDTLGLPTASPPKTPLAGGTSVDDATTLLAALRLRPARSSSLPTARHAAISRFMLSPKSLSLLIAILIEEGLLKASPCAPDLQTTRKFLDETRSDAQARLLKAWYRTSAWNDLSQVTGLRSPDGSWPNDPLISRRASVALVAKLPPGHWWSLNSFLRGVKQAAPDYLRPASEFDSWYLQDAAEGTFLRGFEAWDAVEGRYLRSLISGPLHWLGAVDLGMESGEMSFRINPWMDYLMDRGPIPDVPPPLRRVSLRSDGRIRVPRQTSRALRYQISRFSAWSSVAGKETYLYHLTADALSAAAKQQLKPAHILSVLQEASGDNVPGTVRAAIERWAKAGSEAQLGRQVILRFKDPDVLGKLRSNRSTARLLGEALGPHAVVVDESDWQPLCNAALRAGLLIGWPDAESALSP